MKTLRFSALLAVALTAMSCGVLRGEYTASEIVAGFNANGGWSFNSTGGMYERRFYSSINTMPDVRAYSSVLGASGIYAMCMSSGSSAPSSGTATLNYNATSGLTRNRDDVALSVGGAVLYKMYATGTLGIFNYTQAMNTGQRYSDATDLRNAIYALNNATSVNTPTWTTNRFLQYLLNIRNDREYWILDYNTNLRYTELGDFAVFMMNTGNGYQTNLYLSYASHLGNFENPGVPEPATLLLWTLGSIGALGFRHYRKRSGKA